MSEIQSSAQTYALGHAAEAFQRLLVQGQLFNPFTPLLLRFGIATAEDIRIESLAVRLREEVVSTGGVARLPALVSAWTRIGES